MFIELICLNFSFILNLKFLLQKYSKQNMTALFSDKAVIKNSRMYILQENELWRVNLMEDFSLVKKNLLELPLEIESLDEILDDICT